MAKVLNLNNEVVKMRKEVKKIRVLTIRKLTRHIAKLKGKKGTEDAVLKNHRRAQRLLEEIHAMKEIKLDHVTKSALGREIDFGVICKKPNSTARDRAIARLISHPLLKTKIANIKTAVEDFKNARQKPARAISSTEQQLEEQLNKHLGETQHSVSKNEGSGKEECFDDSTEERFYNESSGTDESNNNDDFFIGKVKRMKKKRTANTSQPTDPNSKDSNQSSKAGKLESEFYYSLSNTQKPEHVKRNIRGHLPRNKTFEKNHPQKRMPKSSAVKYTIKRSPPHQPLHPSWEASRKMREQISQITAFQGKKIKFDD
ncbi:serum response factor-binding protein 1 [Crotalus adamanteus]|uniref:Serum response factor-binding protein 1 n=1 Tax=Crotalus adamanteus TaxID=8729 RepID=A0AAW1C1K1_CROAD